MSYAFACVKWEQVDRVFDDITRHFDGLDVLINKAGVAAMTVTWAKEFVRYGIRVNSISPGFIGTELVRSMKPEALAKMESMIPAGRVGEPEEIAHTVQYLVENDFVNGRDIEIDGGMRL